MQEVHIVAPEKGDLTPELVAAQIIDAAREVQGTTHRPFPIPLEVFMPGQTREGGEWFAVDVTFDADGLFPSIKKLPTYGALSDFRRKELGV